MANEKRLDLIDRNAIVTLMCRACNNECCEEPCEPGECFMYDTLTNAPTVNAVEVVHAEWACVNESDNVWMCTGKNGCGNEILLLEGTPTENGWKHCPSCGAKMDGGNDDG